MKRIHITQVLIPMILLLMLCSCETGKNTTTGMQIEPSEARAIAREAYIYANPLVDNYRIQYASFVDSEDPDFKSPWNQIENMARVYTPDDVAIQTPNSDTPYSWLGLDLRAEPIVLTLPPIEESRYYSIQLIDMYTHNFDYLGSRTTGNDGGSYLIAGPSWEGNKPEGIQKVVHAETDLVVALYRTQLFLPEDMENIKRIQEEYKVQTLSEFLGQPAAMNAPDTQFIKPLSRDEIKTSPKVFEQLNFILQFCPTHPSEEDLMMRFAKIGIGAGKSFDINNFSQETQAAIEQGIIDAWEEDFAGIMEQTIAGEINSADVFGTREYLQNQYTYRMAAAVLGIWGNTADEAIYPSYYVDSDGQDLNGANRYTMAFEKGQLPPVNAFWSLTMYELPASLLVANPINRYLLNSTMVPDFVPNEAGSITLYFQHESPGESLESNWLPAPEGPFSVVMRLYWPKAEALDGTWKEPKIQKK